MTTAPQVLIQTGITVRVYAWNMVREYKASEVIIDVDGQRMVTLKGEGSEYFPDTMILTLPPIEQATITHKQYINSEK